MSRDEVRAFDAWAINELGTPGPVLMENAGRSCAELIIQQLADIDNGSACIFCGTGNNGGDGYVIARHLANASVRSRVVIIGAKEKIKGDARLNLDIIEKMKIPIEQMDISAASCASQIKSLTAESDILVDAIFGTGLRGEIAPDYQTLIRAINDLRKPIIAVDIPSVV